MTYCAWGRGRASEDATCGRDDGDDISVIFTVVVNCLHINICGGEMCTAF